MMLQAQLFSLDLLGKCILLQLVLGPFRLLLGVLCQHLQSTAGLNPGNKE